MQRISRSLVIAAVVQSLGCTPEPTLTSKPKIETRKTVGRTTQVVLDLEKATADGAVLASSAAASDGAIDAIADGARAVTGSMGMLAAEQKMRLYEAEHGSRPKTHAEFVRHIIDKGGPAALSLPMLPYYQEYAFDPATKTVVIVEFPEKKAQRQQETTGASGL